MFNIRRIKESARPYMYVIPLFFSFQVNAHGLPSEAVFTYGIIYLAPYIISFFIARKNLWLCASLCLVVYDISWRFIPLGFILPWLIVPLAGALRYVNLNLIKSNGVVLKIYLILSIILSIAFSNWRIDSAPIANGIYSFSNSPLFPSLDVLPISTSAFASGDANYYNEGGFFAGLVIQFTLLFFYLLVSIEKILFIIKNRNTKGPGFQI